MTHELKCKDRYFQRVWSGEKTFEVRVSDRDFQKGDKVNLIEIDSISKVPTGKSLRCEITYVLHLRELDLRFDNWTVFSITILEYSK